MSEQQQPKEYIITEDQLHRWEDDCLTIFGEFQTLSNSSPTEISEKVIQAIRSRPHPAPQAPAFKRCCDSCINVPCKVLDRVPCLAQEKQENICEENGCTDIENCDEICQHSRLFSSLQMQEAKEEAARKAREKFVSVIRELRNALIVSANNAHERKAIVNEVKPERMFYNEMQFQSLVEFALEKSNGFKPEYEDSEPLIWKRESLRHSTQEARR